MTPGLDINRAQRSSKRGWLWILLIVILGGIGWWLWGNHHAAGDSHSGGKGKRGNGQTPVVQAAAAARKDVPVYLDGLGTVQASNTVTVHTQVDGQLLLYNFKEGQDVAKGDILARIDPRTYQAALDQDVANKAKDAANLENAKRDLTRYKNLGNAVSGQILDTQASTVHQLEASVQSDQAAIESAQAQLSYTVIRSPIDGRTGIQQVDPGNIVHAADANGLVVLTQLEPIDVIFSLPQQDLQPINEQIAAQGKLSVTALDSNNQNTLDEGVLMLIDNQIDQTTGTIKLKSTFPNEKHLLWPGGFVNVRLLLKTLDNALIVPTPAIQLGPQTTYVFVLKDDNTVELRNVKVALTEGQDTVVTDGLKDGEKVITDGAGKLEDGTKVALPAATAATGTASAAASEPAASEPAKQHHKGKKERE